ncbi:hypothetical protein [Tahibacter amnicola]|uniref:Uncharacterized protein n=1 Tax=Tahibacter amnicola TaxID=2976241 RepID=A0ABY6B7A0_9GAMM|nr:hypothetical protein [Tahibacter amnicola]UXI65976.1 hypothetical protein N4264_14550 [Tahibacter amnicola]
MTDYSFVLPPDFSDYEWEVTAKGHFSGATIAAAGAEYRLSFYDAARLSQEVASELDRGMAFFEPNLIVISSVNRREMEDAAYGLIRSGQLSALVPA